MAAVQPNHEDAIKAAKDWVGENGIPSYSSHDARPVENRKFVPEKLLRDYLRKHVSEILKALFGGRVPRSVSSDAIWKTHARVFFTLLFAGRGLYIGHFLSRNDLGDSRLPFFERPTRFPDDASDPFFDTFKEEQWRFCPAVLLQQQHIEIDEKEILPIIAKEKLAEGSTSVVFKVTLHADYASGARDVKDGADPLPQVFAMKIYRTAQAQSLWEDENTAYYHVAPISKPQPGIIGFLGSFWYKESGGTPVYNTLLEYADQGTLEDFFTQHPHGPQDGHDILLLWDSLFDLAKALDRIHHLEIDVDDAGRDRELLGWHEDVKLANILVLSKPGSQSPFDVTFKLTDLGLCHFKGTTGRRLGVVARGAHGTRAFGAPENYRADDFLHSSTYRITQKVDLWSIGCVQSVFAVWVTLGLPAVERYSQVRSAETNKIDGFRDGDCFHDGHKRLQCVGSMHDYLLKNSIRLADKITPLVLKEIVPNLLKEEPDARWDVRLLYTRLQEISAKAANDLKRHDTMGNTHSSSIQDVPGQSRRNRTTSGSPLNESQSSRSHQRSGPSARHPSVHFEEDQHTLFLNEDLHSSPKSTLFSEDQYFTEQEAERPMSDSLANFTIRLPFDASSPGDGAALATAASLHNLDQSRNERSDISDDEKFARKLQKEEEWLAHGMPVTPGAVGSPYQYSQPRVTRNETGNRGQRPSSSQPTNLTRQTSAQSKTLAQRNSTRSQNSARFAPLHGVASQEVQDPHSGTVVQPNSQRPESRPSDILSSSYSHVIGHSPTLAHRTHNRDSSLPSQSSPGSDSPAERDDRSSITTPARSPIASAANSKRNTRDISSAWPPPRTPQHESITIVPSANKRAKKEADYLAVAELTKWRNDKKKLFRSHRARLENAVYKSWLKGRDHVFLIDDSVSMSDHWGEVLGLLEPLSYLVKDEDPDGIELYFTISGEHVESERSSDLVKAVQNRRPGGDTDIEVRLSKLLTEHQAKLHDQNSQTRWDRPGRAVKPLSLYIFTDGIWKKGTNAEVPICAMVKKLTALGEHRGQVGIQFISFGNNEEGIERMTALDHLDKRRLGLDIVDTEPSRGNVWKMVLGAVDPCFDDD